MYFKYLSFLFIIFCATVNSQAQKNQVQAKPDSGIYFVSRHTLIDSTNYRLYTSLRPSEKKDINHNSVIIKSNGEGWLNRDSIPIGEWVFYAHDEFNKEYVLKSGNYRTIDEQMFRFKDEDYESIDEYGFSLGSLLEYLSGCFNFIKSGKWNYYHPNEKLWKEVNFKFYDLYINLHFVKTRGETVNESVSKIVIDEKEDFDEWPKEKIEEYDSDGFLYKKLFFSPEGKIILKQIFDKKGRRIEEVKDFTK